MPEIKDYLETCKGEANTLLSEANALGSMGAGSIQPIRLVLEQVLAQLEIATAPKSVGEQRLKRLSAYSAARALCAGDLRATSNGAATEPFVRSVQSFFNAIYEGDIA